MLMETQASSYQIEHLLSALDNPEMPLCPDDERDDETDKMEAFYMRRMNELRNVLHSSLHRLQQGCDDLKSKIATILRNQQMYRPISEQDIERAIESIRRRQQITEVETKHIVANSIMIMQTMVADATKRRRNFSKEATAILQEYYDNHLDHPYPNEEDKISLAERCHISVQQVSNWFGNRRIRTKRTRRSHDFTCSERDTSYLQNGDYSALNSKAYPAADQDYLQSCEATSCNYMDAQQPNQKSTTSVNSECKFNV